MLPEEIWVEPVGRNEMVWSKKRIKPFSNIKYIRADLFDATLDLLDEVLDELEKTNKHLVKRYSPLWFIVLIFGKRIMSDECPTLLMSKWREKYYILKE